MKPIASALLVFATVALLSLPVVAQDEAPATTVVPNDQFCNLVSDDIPACEQALATLASAGMLPEAFAALISSSEPAHAPSGDAIVTEGSGSVAGTRPFDLAGGDYEVKLDKQGDCDVAAWFLRQAAAGRMVESFEQSGYVYAVEPGRHFVKVIAPDRCRWTLTIKPSA